MEAGEDLIQMEDIAVFDGVEFFFRKFFQIIYKGYISGCAAIVCQRIKTGLVICMARAYVR